MALWQFLILVCIGSPVGPALASAQRGRYGPGGYALAIGVGLAVGACCGWVMLATHKVFGEQVHRRFPSETSLAKLKWSFRGFYLAKILWNRFCGVPWVLAVFVLLRIVLGGHV